MKTLLLTFCLALSPLYAEAEKNPHGRFVRSQVEEVSNFRYQVIGLIYDIKTKATCTGTLIGPRQVLTAAHCVYNFKSKEWSENFTFTPGVTSSQDITRINIGYKRFFIQKEYMQTMKEEFDFALVELDADIGKEKGWAGFRSLTQEERAEGAVIGITFAGYPGDKDFGTLWGVKCPGTITGDLFNYLCDSYSGMSGSALFKVNDNQNFVIGVHTWGGIEKNGGVFLTSKNFTLIDQWKNSAKYSDNTVVHSKK